MSLLLLVSSLYSMKVETSSVCLTILFRQDKVSFKLIDTFWLLAFFRFGGSAL